MSVIAINTVPTAKPPGQSPGVSPVEPGQDAFQKVLEKQLNHQKTQKKPEEAVKTNQHTTQTHSALSSSTSKALNDPNQPSERRARKSAQQDTVSVHDMDEMKSALLEKNAADKRLGTDEGLLDDLELLGLSVAENPDQPEEWVSSSQAPMTSSEPNRHESAHQDALEVVENPLLPMLNMINIASTIQAKRNLSKSLPDKSAAVLGDVGFMHAKVAGLPPDTRLDRKMTMEQPTDTGGGFESLRIPDPAGLGQGLSEGLKQQSADNDRLEVKSLQSINPLQGPASAIVTAPVLTTPVQSAQAVMTNIVEPPLGSPAWSEAISQKVVWMVGTEQQSATLTLNPPDLGPLQVVIQVHNEQADATFISQNPEVRQALEDGMENLRNMMTSAGVQLGQANVHDHQARQEAQQPIPNPTAKSENAKSPTTNISPKILTSNGLVDTFA